MSFRVTLAAAAMTAVVGFGFSAVSVSAQSVEASLQQRHDLMESFGEWSKTLAASAKAGTADAATAKAAEDISAGMKKIPALFPAGSGSDKVKSRAKPEIWTDFAKFEAYAKEGEATFTALAAAAKGGDGAGVTAAFTKASGTCNNCHRDFRGPRQ